LCAELAKEQKLFGLYGGSEDLASACGAQFGRKGQYEAWQWVLLPY